MDDNSNPLLSSAFAGDERALAELIQGITPELRRRIHLKIGSRYRSQLAVDDVLQITFIEAFLNASSCGAQNDTAFRNWLLSIAENNIRDAIRGLEATKRPPPGKRIVRRNSGDSYDLLIEAIGATQTTPSRIAGIGEAIDHLEQAISLLPPDYAEVVRSVDLQQRSVQEVAATMGRTPGAVYMLRSRAHEALRNRLGSASRLFSFEG